LTEERARELAIQHGCKLLPSRPAWLDIVTERINQKYQCPLDALDGIDEQDFVKIITGRGRGMKALPGVYSDYRYR
jgi:hypothetical protein